MMPGRSLHDSIAADPHGTPIYWLNLPLLAERAAQVLQALPQPFYAVKANSHPLVLQTLIASGVRCFDIASIGELQRVQGLLPNAQCAFMNPVKTAADIRQAWQAGVRLFALDSMDELHKLQHATGGDADCCLLVRIAVEQQHAPYEMSGKFGAGSSDAVLLLQAIAARGMRAGITFHVGSQCEAPEVFATAVETAARVVQQAGVTIDVLDVGGGFPASYCGDEATLAQFGEAIRQAVAAALPVFGPQMRLHSEPGRALVAQAGSVAVRVEARKGNMLILSDGKHGLLSELWWMRALHPVRRIYRQQPGSGAFDLPLLDYALAGPTCDSGDVFPGPYPLPADVAAGDWLEIGFLGAYSLELATGFNGYGRYRLLTASPVNQPAAMDLTW